MEKIPHLVNWGIVCKGEHNGGLGVKRLDTLNKALLGKWSWHFMEERGGFFVS